MRNLYLNLVSSTSLKLLSKCFSVLLTIYLIRASVNYINENQISYWLTFITITSFNHLYDFGLSTSVSSEFSKLNKAIFNKYTVMLSHLIFILFISFFSILFFYSDQWLISDLIDDKNFSKIIIALLTASLIFQNYFEKIFIGLRLSYFYYFFQCITFVFIYLYISNLNINLSLNILLMIYFSICLIPGLITFLFFTTNKYLFFCYTATFYEYFQSFIRSFQYWLISISYIFFIIVDLILLVYFYGSTDLLEFNLYLRVFQIIIIPPLFISNISWGQFSNSKFFEKFSDINKLFKTISLILILYYVCSILFVYLYFDQIMGIFNHSHLKFNNSLYSYFIIKSLCEICLFFFITSVNSLSYGKKFIVNLLIFCFAILLLKILLLFFSFSINALSLMMALCCLFLFHHLYKLYKMIQYDQKHF